jgi:hypothetical protein
MKTPLKIVVLEQLTRNSLNRIEASILIGDTALNSTVSALHNLHGIEFNKWKEPYQHRGGEEILLTRYKVSESSFAAAYKLINKYKNKPSVA